MKIEILENNSEIEVFKIKFGNWKFEKLFENDFFFLKLNFQIGMEIRLFEKSDFWKSFKREFEKIEHMRIKNK